MAGHRFSAGWMLALSAAAAFVVGASAQEGARAIRGVVTPDNPIWGQDPQTTPPPQQEETTGRGGRGANQAPAPRPYAQVITSAAKTDEGIFKVHRDRRHALLRDSEGELDKDFLWVTQIKKTTIGAGYGGQAVGQPRRALGAEGRPRAAREHRLQHRRRSEHADPAAVDDANYPAIIRDVQRRGVQRRPAIRSSTSRRSSRPTCRSSRRAARVGGRGMRRDADVPREGRVVPAEHQRRSRRRRLHGARTRRRPRPAPDAARRRARRHARRPSATVLVHHSMVKLPEKPMMPRAVRRARRLLHAGPRPTTARDEQQAVAEALHHALPPREEGSRTRRCPSR